MQINENSTSKYITDAYRYDFLSRTEERELLEAFKLKGDMHAREKLIHANLGNVLNLARELAGYKIKFEDLVQAGNVGLIKAVDKFSLDHDVRLGTFAIHLIKSEMFDFIVKNVQIMNIATSKPLKKAFFSLRKLRKHLGTLNEQEISEIAAKLNIKTEHVKEMEQRLTGHAVVSYDTPPEHIGTFGQTCDINFSPKDFIASDTPPPDDELVFDETQRHLHNTMYSSLKSLDDRSKDIIQRRWLSSEKATLHELAEKYNVSAERIRQLEANALKQMRTWMVN